MKSIIISSVFLLLSISSFAQNDKYEAAMKNNIAAIDTSFNVPANLLKLANNFERIANSEKTQWLAYYYASLCQVNYTYMEQDKSMIDAIADKASSLLDKADALQPNNSEISCVRSMIASAHMMVNPMQRYMEYGPASAEFLEKALKQDPTNPRPEYLKGQGLKFTPEQFGGGCATAKPVLQSSLAKYGKFKAASEIHPNWGKERVELLISECK